MHEFNVRVRTYDSETAKVKTKELVNNEYPNVPQISCDVYNGMVDILRII